MSQTGYHVCGKKKISCYQTIKPYFHENQIKILTFLTHRLLPFLISTLSTLFISAQRTIDRRHPRYRFFTASLTLVGSSPPAHPYMGQALQKNEIQPTSLCQQKHDTLGLAAASHTRGSIGSSAGAIVLSRTPRTRQHTTGPRCFCCLSLSIPPRRSSSSSVLRRCAAHHCHGIELLMLWGSCQAGSNPTPRVRTSRPEAAVSSRTPQRQAQQHCTSPAEAPLGQHRCQRLRPCFWKLHGMMHINWICRWIRIIGFGR